MTKKEKKAITREKHPRRVTQGHKLAALMKKRKEEILQRTFHITFESTAYSTVQRRAYSTFQ